MLVSTSCSRWGRSPPNWVTSMPEQKAGGAPVSITLPTFSSSPSAANASASSIRRSIERALRFSGRCSVTTATSSCRSSESRPAIRAAHPLGFASGRGGRTVKSHTEYMTFETEERREFVRITQDVQKAVDTSGVAEGMVLVSAMHITAGVWVNDDEPGIHADTMEWLDKLAPPSWLEPVERRRAPAAPAGRRRLPPPPRRRGQRRRPPEEPAHPPAGGAADHRRPPGPWTVAGRLLHRVRRPPAEAAGDQGDRGLARRANTEARRGSPRCWSSSRSSRFSSARRWRRRCSTRRARRGRSSTGCCSRRCCCSRSGGRGG